MTDARLPARFLTDHRLNELSDSAWRLITCALIWSNEQGTDGRIPYSALRLLGSSRDASNALELIAHGFWVEAADGFQYSGDWERYWGQSWAEDVEAKRASNRLRQKTYRDRVNSELDLARNQGAVTRYVGQERQDRQGQVGQVEVVKRCWKCGAKTSAWDTDPVRALCLKCETDENPL